MGGVWRAVRKEIAWREKGELLTSILGCIHVDSAAPLSNRCEWPPVPLHGTRLSRRRRPCRPYQMAFLQPHQVCRIAEGVVDPLFGLVA